MTSAFSSSHMHASLLLSTEVAELLVYLYIHVVNTSTYASLVDLGGYACTLLATLTCAIIM